MNMTIREKRDLVELLSIIFHDREFLMRAHAVNEETVKLTEELLHALNFCNNATSTLLAGIQCFPKSKNAYGWLIGCLSAILKKFKMNSVRLKSNLFCSAHVISPFRDSIKTSLL